MNKNIKYGGKYFKMLFRMIYQPTSKSFTSLQSFVGKECNVHSFHGDNAYVTFDGIDKMYIFSIYDLVPLSSVKKDSSNKNNDPRFKSQVKVGDDYVVLNEEKQTKKKSNKNTTSTLDTSTTTTVLVNSNIEIPQSSSIVAAGETIDNNDNNT